MNELKVKFTGEVTRRWKEKTSTGREMVYIAVKVPRGEWADVFRVKAKDADAIKAFDVGAKVTVEAFVGGREWKNDATGKTSYFTDLNLYKIAAADGQQKKIEEASSEAMDDEEIPF